MQPSLKSSTQIYFAAETDPDMFVKACQEKISIWRKYITSRGLAGIWEKKLLNYYGQSFNGNSSQGIQRGGSEGELSLAKVNQFGTLLRTALNLITNQRPAGQAAANNTDTKTLKNAKLGTILSEFYLTQLGWEITFKNAAEAALLCDESYCELVWNAKAGEPVAMDPNSGEAVNSGDAEMRMHMPWNVARDPYTAVNDQTWHIVSFKTNRFDLAATYPDKADAILSAAREEDGDMSLDLNTLDENQTDEIFVHRLIHQATPAVPAGRYALFVGDELLNDSAIPFPEVPLSRMSPADVLDGPVGYANSNDMLGIAEIQDSLHSVVTTNQTTFGVQCIVGPKGAGLSYMDLAKGLRYLELDPQFVDKVKPLQLTATAPEVFRYLEILDSANQQTAGVSSVILGDPSGALKGASGSALALLQSQSIQSQSGAQASYYRLLSSVMTKLIAILRVYATSVRVVQLVGKSNKNALKTFQYTGQDLNSISAITFEMVNPVSQTIGGRVSTAENLLESGLLKSPKEYLTVLQTGNLDTLIGDDADDQMNILAENERLSDHMPVTALVVENHEEHIKAHMSVVASPDAKEDQQLVQATLDHIQQHLTIWQQLSATNPALLIATGQKILPVPQPPGMLPQGTPPGPAGGPPQPPHGAPPPQVSQPKPPQAVPPNGPAVGGSPEQAPPGVEAQKVKPAQLPINPSTGQRTTPQG